MTPGVTLGETDYQLLSTALALLFNGKAGMQSSDMHALAKAIGLARRPTGAARRSRSSSRATPSRT